MRDKHHLKKMGLEDCGNISVTVNTDIERKQTLQELLLSYY